MLSGHIGVCKPNKQAFEHLIIKHAIVPQETLYIDDSKENVQQAREVGFAAVLFTPSPSAELQEWYNVIGYTHTDSNVREYMKRDVHAVVLAAGKSTRFEQGKASNLCLFVVCQCLLIHLSFFSLRISSSLVLGYQAEDICVAIGPYLDSGAVPLLCRKSSAEPVTLCSALLTHTMIIF